MRRLLLPLSFLLVFAAGLALGPAINGWLSAPDETAPDGGYSPSFGDIRTREGVLRAHEEGFNRQAAAFLSENGNSLAPIEHLHAIVQLEEQFPYDTRDIAGCDIAYYADRFIGARHLLTSHLLSMSPEVHRAKFQRLHDLLERLNTAEREYQTSFVGGTGAYRNRRVEHMEVEKALSKWALRLATGKHPNNLAAAASFKALRDKLGQNDEDHGHLYPDQVEGFRKGTRAQRDNLIGLLDELALELTTWPPEASQDLAALILRTF